MRFVPNATSAALALLLTACAELTGPGSGTVDVRLEAAGVVVANNTRANIYYHVVEHVTDQTLLYLWAPCSKPDRCAGVAAGASVTVPYDDILGWHADSRELKLYYWHLVQRVPGIFEADAIRSLVISR